VIGAVGADEPSRGVEREPDLPEEHSALRDAEDPLGFGLLSAVHHFSMTANSYR
jgi:hypothetical protein